MTHKLDLSLPERESSGAAPALKVMIVVNMIILAVVTAILAVILLKNTPKTSVIKGAVLTADAQRQLALKLEKQGLNAQSAGAWKEYLRDAQTEKTEAAKIWYRIGALYQDAHQYDQALAAYYRSERFARIAELSPEIARRVQESLESLGKFAALRDELSERVGLNKPVSDKDKEGDRATVVAEIGSEKITLSDLDHQIEKNIDRRLSMMSPYMPGDVKNRQKEALLKQFSNTQQREGFLNRYLAQEILYREARASNLADDPAVQSEIKDQERAILAGRLIKKAYADNIKITTGDLQTYYEAHQAEYKIPRRVKISQIVVKDAAGAKKIRNELESGKEFSRVARAESLDKGTAENGGKIDRWIIKGKSTVLPELNDAEIDMDRLFKTESGQVIKDNIAAKDGIHILRIDENEPERQKSFKEVQNQIYAALRARKERETRQNLLERLKDKYKVVLHASVLKRNHRSKNPGSSSRQNESSR